MGRSMYLPPLPQQTKRKRTFDKRFVLMCYYYYNNMRMSCCSILSFFVDFSNFPTKNNNYIIRNAFSRPSRRLLWPDTIHPVALKINGTLLLHYNISCSREPWAKRVKSKLQLPIFILCAILQVYTVYYTLYRCHWCKIYMWHEI